jgi:flavodoxin
MRALVVYESMFGNTHAIADHIAEGLRARFEVDVVSVADATPDRVGGADLLVVGGPTHVHSMTSKTSRNAAREQAEKDEELELDEHATDPGLRDWFDEIEGKGAAAAFDTRIDAPAAVTGRASRGIARRLKRHGFHLAADAESFLVDKHNHLIDGEADRATEWGKQLAASAST